VLPGVENTLQHMAQRGALLGVATGNLESIGWTKLTSAGLRDWFRFGGFSDRYLLRTELVAAAAESARTLLGTPTAEICVVGDTPRDIEAARASGLSVIAVATGRYGFEELAALEPDLCTTTLADLLGQKA
jgi:phosphoglycolate phosphatase-like HAD superfamily hydrolase